MEADFWALVKAVDLDGLAVLLGKRPELAGETFAGDAADLDLEAESPFTNTALHFAAVHGHHGLAAALLSAGADPNALGYTEKYGLAPPLLLATGYADHAMMELLLDSGADPNMEGSAESPLYCAIESGRKEEVKLLLSRGARHNVFTAAMAGEVGLVLYHLRAYPALLKARSRKRQRTPWDEAATHEQDDVMAAIRKWTEERKQQEPEPESQLGGDEAWADWETEPSAPSTTERPGDESPAPEGDWSDWVEEDSSWPG